MQIHKLDVLVSQSKPLIYLITVIAGAEMLCFSGIFYGLNSLVPTLKVQNYFLDQCNLTLYNLTGTCSQQNQLFGYALITGIASCNILALPIGALFDKYGYRNVKIFSSTLIFVGALLFALSSIGNNLLLFAAMFFLGICGQCLCVVNFPLGGLIPKYQNIIVALFSGFFDSSVAIFIFVSLASSSGVSLLSSFISISICGLVLILLDAVLLMGGVDVLKSVSTTINVENLDDISPKEDKSHSESSNDVSLEEKIETSEPLERKVTKNNEESSANRNLIFEKYKLEKYPNVKLALSSRYYLLQLMFMVLIFFRFTFFMAELSSMLSNNFPLNPTAVTNYLFISSFFFVNGFIVGAIAGSMVDAIKNRFKDTSDPAEFYKSIMSSYGIPLLICALTNELMSIFIIIPQDWAVYAAYTVLTINRSFLFALNAAYIVLAFPAKYFGKVFGISLTACGCVSFLQFALLFNDPASLNIVNYCLIGLSVVPFIQPILLLLRR